MPLFNVTHGMILPEEAKLNACMAYARMLNTLDVAHIEPLLCDDVRFRSQWVFEEMVGKNKYLDYITAKLASVKRAGERVWAEAATTDTFQAGFCIVLSQGEEKQFVATVLLTMKEDKISAIDLCGVPSPEDCKRLGYTPV